MNKVIADRMKSFDITCYDENGSKIDDIINSATKIKFPHAQASNLNLDKCREIGLVLSRCKMLQELCLSGNRGSLREDMLAALFLAEGPYNFPLQSLDFGNNQFGMRELTTILPFLKSWEELDYLSLEGNCINNEGAQLLADSLDTVKIRRLSLNRNQISKEGLSSILTSQNARYLASLMISDNEDIGSAEIDETARFLSRATTNLKLLQVGNHRQCFRIEWFEKLCRSLQNNTTMSKISIVGSLHGPIEIFISNEQRKNMEKYMADLMKSFGITCCNENGSKIDDIVNNATKIEFPSALHLNLDKCREIGLVLSRCKMLQELCLSGNRGSLGEDMLVALFLAEGPYNFPLKRLDLGNNQFGMRELTTILPFLKSWEELNSLSVEGNCINNEGAQLLAEVLDTVKIRRLSLNRNQINKEGLSSILSSQNARYLTSLMISNNGHIGSAEIDEIASFLRHGSSSLEVLEVGNYRQYFLIQWVETIYRSIRNNTTLSKLRVFAGSLHDPMGKEASRKAISCWLDHAAAALVCDSSSIDAFCRSNHTFSGVELTEATLSVRYAPSPVVRLAFKINSRGDMSTVKKIRCKLHSIFFHGDFDMEPFYAMKLVWIPQVLEFFAGFEQHRGAAEETKGGSLTHAASLSDLYYFIRRWNFPELFTFALPTRAS